MADAVDTTTKAVDAVDKATGMIEQVAKAIQDASATYGPQVVDLTLESARILAIQDIVSGIVGLVLSYILFKYATKWYSSVDTKYEKDLKENRDAYVDSFPYEVKKVFCGASVVAACLIMLFAITDIINIRSWYGMVRPDVYIASGIVKKALK